MVRILADGDSHLLETTDGRRIGWIRDRAIGFTGFESRDDALQWAIEGWSSLQSALERSYSGWPRRSVSAEDTRIDGDTITDGATAIARLVNHDDASFAIEFELPTYATDGVAISAASQVGTTMLKYSAPEPA
jgi:hypothetical protein